MIKWLLSLSVSTIAVLTLHAEVPELFLKPEFSAATLAQAVNHYIELGEDRATTELNAISRFYAYGKTDDENLDNTLARVERTFSPVEREAWVCRILFEPKPHEVLREPNYGGLMLPWLTMPAGNWPLFPVAHSGRTFFVLGEGYAYLGVHESPREYLDYCRTNGTFRIKPIPVPTRAEAKADAAALWTSPAWRAIKWTDKALNMEYTMPEQNTRVFIQKQFESIEDATTNSKK